MTVATPTVCWPWRLRDMAELDHHPRGGECKHCRRDIAVPRDAVGDVVCLYCGMALGLVEMVERPIA